MGKYCGLRENCKSLALECFVLYGIDVTGHERTMLMYTNTPLYITSIVYLTFCICKLYEYYKLYWISQLLAVLLA